MGILFQEDKEKNIKKGFIAFVKKSLLNHKL